MRIHAIAAIGLLLAPSALAQTAQPSTIAEATTQSSPSYIDDYSRAATPRNELTPGHATGLVAYDFAIPLGSVRDFSANVSPLGLELQFRAWLRTNLTVGFSAEWSTFVDDRPRTTYQVDDGAVTASAYNNLVTTNGRFLLHYYFMDQGSLRPYVGAHVGMGWSTFRSEAADLSLSDTEFSIAYGADLGALFRANDDPMILANVRYSSQPGSEFLGIVDNVQTISMQVGVGL